MTVSPYDPVVIMTLPLPEDDPINDPTDPLRGRRDDDYPAAHYRAFRDPVMAEGYAEAAAARGYKAIALYPRYVVTPMTHREIVDIGKAVEVTDDPR